MTLTGIATARGNRIAIFRDAKRKEAASAFVGDIVEGWTVEEVEAERVVLVHKTKRKTLKIWAKEEM